MALRKEISKPLCLQSEDSAFAESFFVLGIGITKNAKIDA